MRAIFLRRTCSVVLSALLYFVAAGQSRAADPLDQWHWRNPLPQGNALANVVWANNQYVAVGELGTLLTSSDGTNWTAQQSTTLDQLRDCACGNGTYVTVGDYGTILTSTNGVDWTPQFGGTFYSLNGVTFGNNRFVAVGNGGTILTSENGQDWTLRATGPWIYYDVIFAENLFVAGGQSNIVTSADGITWTRRSGLDGGTVLSLAYGDGKFAAVADSGRGYSKLLTSNDGLAWQSQTAFPSSEPSLVVSCGTGVWVAASSYQSFYSYTGKGTFYTSADAFNWTVVATNSVAVTGIAFGDGGFVTSSGTGGILSSGDGTNWTSYYGITSGSSFRGVANLIYANGSFTGVVGTNVISSTDGQNWMSVAVATDTPAEYPPGSFSCIAYGNGRYVIGGAGQLLTSPDGLNWVNPAPGFLYPPNFGSVWNVGWVRGLAHGNGTFVGVGDPSQYVFTSPDGLVWSARRVLGTNVPSFFQWSDITFGNGLFVAVDGSSGYMATTSDGTDWTLQQQGNNPYLNAIAYGRGRFVAVGLYAMLVSTDGRNWTRIELPGVMGFLDVAYGGGWFVAVGYNDTRSEGGESPIWVSRDGFSWTKRKSHTRRMLLNVAYGNGTFVISSGDGAILQSDPFLNLSFDLLSGPRLTVTGPSDRRCIIESTESLAAPVTWQPESDVLMEGGAVTIAVPSLPTTTNRFYRAKLLP